MRTVAIIQARMNSSRLPGKVLAEAAGKPLLQHMLERVGRCETLDDIVVATCDPAEEIRDCCSNTPASVYVGSEEDVLGRVLGAARAAEADVIVELTADCPLIDPMIIREAVERFAYMRDIIRLDFLSTSRDSFRCQETAYPRGMDVRVFATDLLAEVDRLTDEPEDDPAYREHVSLYIWQRKARYGCCDLRAPENLRSNVRLTVDTPEDLELVRTVFEANERGTGSNDFSLGEILTYLDSHPEVAALNAHIQQKATR